MAGVGHSACAPCEAQAHEVGAESEQRIEPRRDEELPAQEHPYAHPPVGKPEREGTQAGRDGSRSTQQRDLGGHGGRLHRSRHHRSDQVEAGEEGRSPCVLQERPHEKQEDEQVPEQMAEPRVQEGVGHPPHLKQAARRHHREAVLRVGVLRRDEALHPPVELLLLTTDLGSGEALRRRDLSRLWLAPAPLQKDLRRAEPGVLLLVTHRLAARPQHLNPGVRKARAQEGQHADPRDGQGHPWPMAKAGVVEPDGNQIGPPRCPASRAAPSSFHFLVCRV